MLVVITQILGNMMLTTSDYPQLCTKLILVAAKGAELKLSRSIANPSQADYVQERIYIFHQYDHDIKVLI